MKPPPAEMDCAMASSFYLDAAGGRLEDALSCSVLEHVRTCPDCARGLAFLDTLGLAAADLRGNAALRDKLAASREARDERHAFAITWALRLAAAAVVLALVPLALTAQRSAPAAQPEAPAHSSHAQEADARPHGNEPEPDRLVEISPGRVSWYHNPGLPPPQAGDLRLVIRAGAAPPADEALFTSDVSATLRISFVSGARIEAEVIRTAYGVRLQRGDRIVVLGGN